MQTLNICRHMHTAPFYSWCFSSIWRMQNIWTVVDLLRLNAHWRFQIISFENTVHIDIVLEDYRIIVERRFVRPNDWRERKLLVAPPMPDRSKDMSQTKCSPWSSRLGVGHGATTPPQKNLLLRNHGKAQDPNRVAASVKTLHSYYS
jgi:hypothetical protein